MNKELRHHQTKAIAMLRQSLMAGKKRPLLQLATGAGKTLIAAAIIEGALAKGKRVVFTVPAISLIDQTVAAFWDEGIRDVGVIQGWHAGTNPLCPVQVASVQTLQRRQLPETDLVIVDEAHRLFTLYARWMLAPEYATLRFIGLSATPWTRGLGRYFDDLLIPTTTQELIDEGYLVPFKVYAPSHPDLTGVRTVAGDYHEGDLSGAMSKSELVADVVETWKKRGEGRSTLCFGVDRLHAKALQQKFLDAGISADYMDAYTPLAEREEIRKRFHSGETKVVCNVGVLTTGIDWDVRALILARPTKSEMLFVQVVGRALRTAEGKDHALILDHSDNHLRLGFVTDIHHATPLPKECPKCAFLKPPKTPLCPQCGFKPEPRSGIECEDGELIELRHKPLAAMAGRDVKQRWWSMLLQYGIDKGYRQGWAANKYREKFGVWPRGLWDAPLPPDLEVTNFIRHGQIRYAKRREAGNARAS
jgi:DNA repair protein RadD